MADRSRLHINKLEVFKAWLVKDGWDIEEPKGTWEVLRARKAGRNNPLIVYTKMDAKEHLSVMDRDSGVLGAFLRDSKKPKTNADRIRAMTDEELAEFLPIVFDVMCQPTNKCMEITCNHYGECEKTTECAMKWLQSEAEQKGKDMANKIDFSSIRHIKVHKEQFDVIEEKASAVIVECKEDGRCVSFTRLKSEKHMTKTLTIEYEKFVEEGITVLSVVENDTVLRMFEGEEAEELYNLLTEGGTEDAD